MQFEWGDAKAKINQRKHGVSFDEAVMVFADPLEYSHYKCQRGNQAGV